MNTVVIVLIVVVIYLISQNMPKKEDWNLFSAGSWKDLGKTIQGGVNQGLSTIGNAVGGANQVEKVYNQKYKVFNLFYFAHICNW